jgi:hypothetical protein
MSLEPSLNVVIDRFTSNYISIIDQHRSCSIFGCSLSADKCAHKINFIIADSLFLFHCNSVLN